MILSYRNDTFTIPHTSVCIIHLDNVNGNIIDDGVVTLKTGDNVEITSPVFISVNKLLTGAITVEDRFTVPLVVVGKPLSVSSHLETVTATLVCDDNDPFTMYARIYNDNIEGVSE